MSEEFIFYKEIVIQVGKTILNPMHYMEEEEGIGSTEENITFKFLIRDAGGVAWMGKFMIMYMMFES